MLPQQRKELHGITPDALNSHFASVSTTDTRVSDECFEVISKASEDGFRFTEVDFNDVVSLFDARGSDCISQSIVAKVLLFLR